MSEGPHNRRGERYTLLRELGSGGFGTVHLAYDRVLQREVALKELRRELFEGADAATAELQRRLLREVRITGQLEHPGIVPIYDLADGGEAGAFYTMRVVRGQPLEAAIATFHERRRAGDVDPLELPRLLTALIGICNAIGYAHSRGVMHRDLKPDNVVLGEFGEVVLLDWGLAKLTDEADEPANTAAAAAVRVADSVRDTGVVGAVGTPAYMAPEQARGAPGPRTDVYGLGAILFELLTGHAPHHGDDSGEVLERILLGPTPRARASAGWVPRALDAICARAMARDPDRRYASPAELADDLQRWLADEPVAAHREPLAGRAWRWMRRHRAWTFALAVAAAITITVTSIAAVLLARLSTNERSAREAAERMRVQGLHVAAKFAARTIASEIDVRWRILEAAAQQPTLTVALHELRALDDPADSRAVAARAPLQRWIEARHAEEERTAKAASWFVTDVRGRHLARSPLDPELLGRDFSFRDYFHGQGRDLAPGRAAPPPITAPHRSVVFESLATTNLMVAFSVPVWDDVTSPTREVLGVLAMTVELGTFAALQIDPLGEQIAVLIETESDWVGSSEGRGLILHHPHLVGVQRIEPTLVEELRRLRADASPGGLRRDYVDPVAPGERWLAVFEPVVVPGRAGRQHDTGWVVAVQERARAGS